MTQQELIETLLQARELLASVAGDLYWQEVAEDAHPTLHSDVNDATHYTTEAIRKLEGQSNE